MTTDYQLKRCGYYFASDRVFPVSHSSIYDMGSGALEDLRTLLYSVGDLDGFHFVIAWRLDQMTFSFTVVHRLSS